jgi:uncharacterized protein YigA (DUF484 family)
VTSGRGTDPKDGPKGEPKGVAEVARPDLTEDQVAAWLRAHPDFLARRPRLLMTLAPPARPLGDNVVDLQHAMLRRLQEMVAALDEQRRTLILGGRANRSNQARIHDCVLALISATSLKHLVHTVTTDLAVLCDVDVATLCVEADGDTPSRPAAGVRLLRTGTVRRLFGDGRDVLLRDNVAGDRAIFGAGSGLVRSEALLRLRVGGHTPPGLLALGSRRPGRFQPGQATELFAFLARVLERSIRAWLHLPY